jgi:hypothetical protein
MNKILPENFVLDLEKILRKARSKLRSPDSWPMTSALGDSTTQSLTPMFEVMANKSLHEYSAPTPDNIRTGSTVVVGDAAFELKPELINMVQASQFCGKANKDANKHLQHFLEICSTFTIKDVPSDVVLLRLFSFSLLEQAKQRFYSNKDKFTTCTLCSTGFLAKFFPIGKTNVLRGKYFEFPAATRGIYS